MATMMTTPLLLQTLLDRGPRLCPDEMVVTKVENGYHRITYAVHMLRTYKLASALRRWGLRHGEVVASFCWNTARHLQLYHAIPCMGSILHTLNVRLAPSELAYIIQHAQDRVIVTDANLLPMLEQVDVVKLRNVELFIVCGDNEKSGGWQTTLGKHTGRPVVDYDEFLASGASHFEWPDFDENTPMGLCFTSGTTGLPKGVAYSHRSTYLHTLIASLTDNVALSGTDTILSCAPMFHANSWGLPFAALMLGSRICMINKYSQPEYVVQMLVDEGVTLSCGVPTIWQDVRRILTSRKELRSQLKLKRVICGGSSPPAEMMKWYFNNFGVEFVQIWGMTEINPMATISRRQVVRRHLTMTPEETFLHVAKAGTLLPGLEMKIVNPEKHDQVLPNDGVASGELLIRGPWVTGSYYRVDAATKFYNGWLLTGDIASIDPHGYLIIRDRSKDMIKSGGEWISSVDLENHIASLPGTKRACVVGMPHPRWDERPVAVVVKDEKHYFEITKDDVIKHCEKTFAKFQIPDDVLFWNEIPLVNLKLDKKLLRAMLEQQGYVLPTLKQEKSHVAKNNVSGSMDVVPRSRL